MSATDPILPAVRSHRPTGGLADWTMESTSLTVTYEFETLCNEAIFKNALVEVFDSTKDRLGVGSDFSNELRSLRGLLEETLRKH